jgi:hypothetical protein
MAGFMAAQGYSAETIALKVRKTEHQVRRKLKWHGIEVRPGRTIRVPHRTFKTIETEGEGRGYEGEALCVRFLELIAREKLIDAVLGN